MIYNLGPYRYNNGKIYKKVFLFFYKKIGTADSYMDGVKKVNKLCGIVE